MDHCPQIGEKLSENKCFQVLEEDKEVLFFLITEVTKLIDIKKIKKKKPTMKILDFSSF